MIGQLMFTFCILSIGQTKYSLINILHKELSNDIGDKLVTSPNGFSVKKVKDPTFILFVLWTDVVYGVYH